MKRRLFNLLAAVSLVLCAAIVVLWVQSLGRTGRVGWAGVGHEVRFWNADGFFSVSFANDGPDPSRSPLGWSRSGFPMPPGRSRGDLHKDINGKNIPNRWGFAAFGSKTDRPYWRFGGGLYVILFMPYWLPVAALVLAPALWLGSTLKARRRRTLGLCHVCGYDLRATPERCPECGAAVSRAGVGAPESGLPAAP